MKKLITFLLVLTGIVTSASAYDDIWLRTDFRGTNQWGSDESVNKFTYVGHDDFKNEDEFSLTIDADDIKTSDIWFRLHINGWGAQISPYNTASYSFTFANGQNETYDARYEQTVFQSSEYSFGISHSTIKAAQYKISLYRGYNIGSESARHMYIKVDIVSMPVSVGAKGFATYCNADRALDFTEKSIKAYTISSTNGSALTLNKVNKIAKNTPVLLYSTTNSDSQDIPVITNDAETDDVTGNKLVAGDGNTYTWTEGAKYYILYTGGENPGFYQANNSNVAVGKAYLDLTSLDTSARSFSLDLNDGETTAIANVSTKNEALNNVFYNLNGQKIAQPAKGLYIMNGRKVIIK